MKNVDHVHLLGDNVHFVSELTEKFQKSLERDVAEWDDKEEALLYQFI